VAVRHSPTGLAALALVALVAAPLCAQQTGEATRDTAAAAVPAESTSVTHHVITLDGHTIHYTATAGNLLVRNDSGQAIGSFFYVAYTEDGTDPVKRPVTFLYNGGPGSSTIWLHMGSVAPVRVVTDDAKPTPPAPYHIQDNPYSLIDKSDLVFVDAMATGLSGIVGKGTGKDFFGVDPDIRSFADFITRYLTVNNRWNSPKFLFGESYGTTRSAGLSDALDDRGIPLNGIVLVSSYLDAFVDFSGPQRSLDLPYELFLPTMAATAWYHDKLSPKPADLTAFMNRMRAFALGPYQQALDKGSRLGAAARDSMAATLAGLTGVSKQYWLESDLRMRPDHFEKELLRGEGRTVARLDARYEGIDIDNAGESPEYDAANVAVNGPFTSAFNDYLANVLDYHTDRTYLTTNYGVVGRSWDDHHHGADMLDVAEDLRQAMSKNPSLRVFSANGYFDFACPFFVTEYVLDHMGLDSSLVRNITVANYQSGHMIYLHTPALAKLKQDLGAFYDRAVHP
jgi:carboxypeptidase C (cathepsin A)